MNTREIASEYRMTHWAQIMRERNESGLSVKAYCESAGFHENIYYYWQRKLREAACRELPANLPESNKLPVPNGWAVCGTGKENAERNSVLIEIGQSRVTVTADVDTGLLAKVCRVLTAL